MREHTHQSITSARALSLDDRVYWGREFIGHVNGTDETHRFQQLLILREGKLSRYRKDMGLASQFPVANNGFNFVAGCVSGGRMWAEYSVGETLEMFNLYRYNIPASDPLTDLRMSGKQTLLDDWQQELDETRQQRAHRSVVGPYLRIQRN